MLHLALSALILGLTAAAVPPALAASAASSDFRGAAEVDGKKVHLEWRGDGGPTVILISGYRNNAAIWTVAPGPGLTPAFTGVAGFTRVCAYDRPNTILDANHLSRSGPALMPRTADAVVAELDSVLQAARIGPPYVASTIARPLDRVGYPGDGGWGSQRQG